MAAVLYAADPRGRAVMPDRLIAEYGDDMGGPSAGSPGFTAAAAVVVPTTGVECPE